MDRDEIKRYFNNLSDYAKLQAFTQLLNGLDKDKEFIRNQIKDFNKMMRF